MTDPYEGWLPVSHMKAMAGLNETYLSQLRETCDKMMVYRPQIPPALLDRLVEDTREKLDISKQLKEVNVKFGLNCWHINDDESEAMWRLYGSAGSGIAIESTEDKLKSSLPTENIQIDRVRYMNFDRDEIEKGHKHYGLFIKRSSFAHERELRATILLPKPGIGMLVPCNIDALINDVLIAPGAPAFYADTVKYIVDHADVKIQAPILCSRLLDSPSYP